MRGHFADSEPLVGHRPPGKVADMPGGTRRGNREGNIEKLPDGRFRGRVRLGKKPDGTIDRPFVYGATRLEVQKKITKLSEDFNVGLRADPTYDKQVCT